MMLTLQNFTGINNVLPSHQLTPHPKTGAIALAQALNVDIGLVNEISRRAGYTRDSVLCHQNVWQGNGFVLATRDGGQLVAITQAATTVLYQALGTARVWYVNLPDRRTAFSNGSINGITDGATLTTWGIPVPPDIGAAANMAGGLFPGDYRYRLTYVRISDALEGGPIYSGTIALTTGLALTGLPQLADHSINVYLSPANGDDAYLAGNTTDGAFNFTGTNNQLLKPCYTHLMGPAPAGRLCAFFRGRALIAVGNELRASRAGRVEIFHSKDVKQFSAPITLVQPVDSGIFVGTETELAFLRGEQFEALQYQHLITGPILLGSGVEVDGEQLKRGQGAATGRCMVGIANKSMVAGYADGGIELLTDATYTTDATEVAATFRLLGGTPQYIAIPQ